MRRARRVASALMLLLAVIVGVELSSWLLLWSLGTEELERRMTEASLELGHQIPVSMPGSKLLQGEVLHPYLGYVYKPVARSDGDALSLEALGFPNGGPFVRTRDPGTLVVGVFGGSLAAGFAAAGGTERLVEQLRDLPEFVGRRLVAVSTALAGYKQPQCLFALSYLIALGMHFDWVILIDGFNDVVLPVVEDPKQTTFPFFPRRWALRVASLDTATDVRALIGEIAYRQEQRRSMAQRFTDSALRRSRFASLVWLILDRRAEAAIAQRRQALLELRPQSLEYLASGPSWSAPGGGLYADLVRFWKSASVQMNAICAANGIRFTHFLQPNQYVPNSKPIGSAERAIAVREDHPMRVPVEAAYPLLRDAGVDLRTAGVAFHDLTMVFKDADEALYVDDCCHINQKGNELLADAMAARVREDLGVASAATGAADSAAPR